MSGEGYGYEAGGWSLGVPPPPLCDAEMTEEEVQQLLPLIRLPAAAPGSGSGSGSGSRQGSGWGGFG